MQLKSSTVQMIDIADWDAFVTEVYGRPYSFQQQDGCRDRGSVNLTVPDPDNNYDEDMPESIPEIVNGVEMGVRFASWLARDPKQPLAPQEDDVPEIAAQMQDFNINIWWDRNFYPDVQAIADDLHARGLLEAGEYVIDIDW